MSHRLSRTVKDLWRTSIKVASTLMIVGSFGSLFTIGCESGGVGDPCVPEDEYKESFSGFDLNEENIESRSFQCQTRICLVNHFQGRVSCPNGQDTPVNCTDGGACDPLTDSSGNSVETSCQAGGVILTDCDPLNCNDAESDPNNCNDPATGGGNLACGGAVCNDGRFCQCDGVTQICPESFRCCPLDSGSLPDGDPCKTAGGLCITEICAPNERNDDTTCYIPGTDNPVGVPVCGQCGDRPQEDAVYCSCRCGPPESGESEADSNFNFCDCPEGFTCEEVRPDVGLGDAQLAGKYCVKQGTVFQDVGTDCGSVTGFWAPQCNGLPAGG
jgi:hypothetical protein